VVVSFGLRDICSGVQRGVLGPERDEIWGGYMGQLLCLCPLLHIVVMINCRDMSRRDCTATMQYVDLL